MFDNLTLHEKINLHMALHEGYMAADRYWEDRARMPASHNAASATSLAAIAVLR